MSKIKTVKKNKGFNFLVVMLILAIALVFGVKMVQKNQENRSKAMYVVDGNYSNVDYKRGNFPYVGYNIIAESECIDISGICASFESVWSDGTPCVVGNNYGAIRKGLCPGDKFVLCCSSQVKKIVPTSIPSLPGLGQSCGINKTGICIKTTLPLNSICKISSTRKGRVAYGYCAGGSNIRCCQ